jgi:hypothetical protein
VKKIYKKEREGRREGKRENMRESQREEKKTKLPVFRVAMRLGHSNTYASKFQLCLVLALLPVLRDEILRLFSPAFPRYASLLQNRFLISIY